MTTEERRLLAALAGMCRQYLARSHGEPERLDHSFMHAGEEAVALLAQYGLVRLDPAGGVWTEAGAAFLDEV